MRRLLSTLFTDKAAATPTANRSSVCLDVEGLGARLVPTMTIAGGDLYIYGDDYADSVIVRDYGSDFLQVTTNGLVYYYSKHHEVWGGDIFFYGYGGSDYFENATNLRSHAWGYDGSDWLIGGSNSDYFYGLNGTDYLCGNGGGDVLDGGYDYAHNYLYGGEGDDYLYGANGTDYMYGDNGVDVLYGRSGDDYLYGNAGMDYLYGEWGNDTLDGGDDGYADYLNGGAGYDRFQQEWAYVYRAYALYGQSLYYWYNRDQPADFDPTQDSFYG